MKTMSICHDQEIERQLELAGFEFGLGELLQATPVQVRSFHSLFKCQYESGYFAIKRLVQRPELLRWRDRFENAFIIEDWLARRHTFLPKPVRSRSGTAICVVEPNGDASSPHWFIAHAWVDGSPPARSLTNMKVIDQIGDVISAVSSVPLSLVKSREHMDDETPEPSEIIDLLHEVDALNDSDREVRRTIEASGHVLSDILTAPGNGDYAIVAHRDLSPTNTLLSRAGLLWALDWENAGPTTIESEVARTLAHWSIGRSATPITIADRIFAKLKQPCFVVNRAFELWFSEWLSGHLMFLRYLLTKSIGDPTAGVVNRTINELAVLSGFIDKLPTLYESLRMSVNKHGWETI